MQERGRCRFYEWDEAGFALPEEYALNNRSSLPDALRVFYSAGGYDFFNVVDPRYYASGWLDFISSLYEEIEGGRFTSPGTPYQIPLDEEKRKELKGRGVPEIFITDIKQAPSANKQLSDIG